MTLQVIKQQELLNQDFKIYGDFENPLFLAKDVAEWIEHTDQRKMVQTVDEEEKLKGTLFLSGQNREMWFLTEDGLYEVLMQSRKKIAKQFKKEVKKILKEVRQTGTYGVKVPQTMKEALLLALEQQEKIEFLSEQKLIAEQRVHELQPKATYYDLVLQNESLLPIGVIAKDYGWSAKRMNEFLHQISVQFKQGKTWLLYQKYADKGYTQSKTSVVNGGKNTVMHTYWTQKGRLFIYDLLKKHHTLPVIERS